MRVAISRIEGVDSVTVSLNQGLATVRFGPDNRATVQQVRRQIRSNGFTPKAAEVRLLGRVLEREGLTVVSAAGQAYILEAHPDAPAELAALRRAVGREVLVEGDVPETLRDTAPAPLRVRSFSLR